MIDVTCGCATPRKVPESAVGKRFRCPGCSQIIQLISGEQPPEGSGAGDFDAQLSVINGPELVGTRYILGGVAQIQIGELPDRHILLPGIAVSRGHCTLQRIDFGPSRWKLIDNRSTNGVFVNSQRVADCELRDGDVITVGDYELRFGYVAPVEAQSTATATVAPSPEAVMGGPVCPSCEKSLPRNAKICVDCGININTGRPVLTAQGIDENSLYEGARQWIRWVSLLVWITPMPIPIRSEAFGTRKPYTIWTIAVATILASIAFFILQNSGHDQFDRPGNNLMLWSPSAQGGIPKFDRQKIHAIARRMTPEARQELRDTLNDPNSQLSDDDLLMAVVTAKLLANRGEFHWYQLITHAFLHDTSSIYNFAMHLAGNMLFLLVFGTRVNALIGNIATAILYPILAVCAATAHLMSLGNAYSGPMLGA